MVSFTRIPRIRHVILYTVFVCGYVQFDTLPLLCTLDVCISLPIARVEEKQVVENIFYM